MDKIEVIELANRLFVAVDERDWNEILNLFNDYVLLDYSSMTGGEPVSLTPAQIVNSWKELLPGFDNTHHQLGNYVVKLGAKVTTVSCYGTATHFLKNDSNNNVWTVVGTYDLEFINVNTDLKVSKMKFNLKYIDGNNDLPVLAQNRLKNM
jgi:hypothetical protein